VSKAIKHTGGWSENRSARDALQAAQDGNEVLCMGIPIYWDSDRRCLCDRDNGKPVVLTPNTLGDIWSIRDQLDAATNIHYGDDEPGAKVRAHMVKGGMVRREGFLFRLDRVGGDMVFAREEGSSTSGSEWDMWEKPFTGAFWEIIPLEPEPECWDFAGQPGLTIFYPKVGTFYRENAGQPECIIQGGWEPAQVEIWKKLSGDREATHAEVAKLPGLTDEQRERYNIPAFSLTSEQAAKYLQQHVGTLECTECEPPCPFRMWTSGDPLPCVAKSARWHPAPAEEPSVEQQLADLRKRMERLERK